MSTLSQPSVDAVKDPRAAVALLLPYFSVPGSCLLVRVVQPAAAVGIREGKRCIEVILSSLSSSCD